MFKNFIVPIVFFHLCISAALTQPTNTSLRSNWDDNSLGNASGVVYNDIWGYADDSGREYAIVGGAQHTFFFDITDPDNPVEVSRIASGQSCIWRDFKTYGHYAYGVSDNCRGGLEIFDLSGLPNTVTKVYDSRTLIDEAHNIFIDTSTHRLYACGIDRLDNVTDLTVLDLSVNPASPSLLKHVNLGIGADYVHDLYVRNDTTYLCNGRQSRMLIYDMRNLSNLVFLGQVASNGYNHSVWLNDDGSIAIVADETHNRPLEVVDISQIDAPVKKSEIKSTLLAPVHTSSLAHNPFIVGNDFAVISYYEDGMQIYKIDNVTEPFRAGYHDTRPGNNNYSGYNGAWGVYPFLPSGNIIASDVTNGLFVITPNFPLRDCQEDVTVSGIYDNYWDFKSKDSIHISALYQNSAVVEITAGDEITLDYNFEIGLGSTLDATIFDVCSSQNHRITLSDIKSENTTQSINSQKK